MKQPPRRFTAEKPGSVREIDFLCVFAPLHLCVYFFQTALRAVTTLTPHPPAASGRGGTAFLSRCCVREEA